MTSRTYAGNTLIEEWDDDLRILTRWDLDGIQTEQRPYTTEENAEADLRVAEEQRVANAQALRDGLANVISAALDRQALAQAVIDTPNSDINSKPAPHIVSLARVCKRQERAIIRLARLAGNLLDSADTGAD